MTRLGLSPDFARRLRDADFATARRALRALLTVRAPGPLPDDTATELDALLGGERLARPTVDGRQLPTIAEMFPGAPYPVADRTVLWRGDFTTLTADAIVNAANSALLGCFVPQPPLHRQRHPRCRRPPAARRLPPHHESAERA